jgi:hypothetical protein
MTSEMLRNFEMLVLPETEVISSSLADSIRAWVHDGGTLIASGRCGLLDEQRHSRDNFALADVLGANYLGEEKKYAYDPEGKLKENVIQTYLESSGHPLARMLSESTVGLSGAFLKLEKREGAEEVMHYRLPFMVEDIPHNKWFNWGPPPPGPDTGGPAVIYNHFGKGQSFFIGAPIFQEMDQKLFWVQKWIPSLVRTLVPDPIAELRFPALGQHLHGTFFRDPSKRFVLVQILNAIELATRGEFVDVPYAEIIWNPAKLKISGAHVVWPKAEDLSIVSGGGKTSLRVPFPGRYTALYLKLA